MKSNEDVVIKADNVKKYFKVYPDKGKTLKDKVLFHKRNKYEKHEVLKGISFEVKRGEAIGLIGKNGCGKSTTLKLLTKILRPNEGTITIDGRVSSLIELGAGFHPDLTGRENIYINASIFGIKAKEVDRRLDDIIRFSELEEFIDNPVRTYSSGMYMRLAFSVAINVDADVLLIDEILAVGDMNFQEKCFNKLQEIKRNGTTIVIVSHAQGQIEKICDRCIWLEDGLVRLEGPTRKVTKAYQLAMEGMRAERARKEAEEELEKLKTQQNEENNILPDEENVKKKQQLQQKLKDLTCREICMQCGPDAHRGGSQRVEFTYVSINDNKSNLIFETGNEISLKVKCRGKDLNNKVKMSVCISRSDGIYCFGTSTKSYVGTYTNICEEKEIIFTFKNTFLNGKYFFDLFIDDEQGEIYDALYQIIEFNVDNTNGEEVGITQLEYTWDID